MFKYWWGEMGQVEKRCQCQPHLTEIWVEPVHQWWFLPLPTLCPALDTDRFAAVKLREKIVSSPGSHELLWTGTDADVQNYLLTATVPFITTGFLFRSLYHFNLFSVSTSFSTIKLKWVFSLHPNPLQVLFLAWSSSASITVQRLFANADGQRRQVEFGFVVFIRCCWVSV